LMAPSVAGATVNVRSPMVIFGPEIIELLS
jgi:hypothetical protein